MSNDATFNNVSHDSTALQIYVCGLNNGQKVVTLSSSNSFYGFLEAPQLTVGITNNGGFHGSIAGNVVNLSNNFSFSWDANDQYLQARSIELYYRTARAAVEHAHRPRARSRQPVVECDQGEPCEEDRGCSRGADAGLQRERYEQQHHHHEGRQGALQGATSRTCRAGHGNSD